MPKVGFETAIPVFYCAKTVHSLDRAAAVIGHFTQSLRNSNSFPSLPGWKGEAGISAVEFLTMS
jgi:hypothetical protein